ncbi:MAG TPA: methyltransferase domain-containing protein [Solirubrobacteraceae bacterium]|nr:methyltransferase domain-containing protein [Solirubrobacteraceae bacterium]
MPEDDLVEETLVVAGREIALRRPRDSEGLLDEHAFEHEEFLPYWAELWPSAIALAEVVGARALKGRRVLELGCGLGLPSIAAALAGGRVLATDWSPAAVRFAADNARRNGAGVTVARRSWSSPEAYAADGRFDLVLASDVLYERRDVAPLLELLPRLLASRGEVLLADPERPPFPAFLAGAREAFTVAEVARRHGPSVRVVGLVPRQHT